MPTYAPPDNITPPAKVFVGETRIPIIDDGVSTQIRKDGPMSISRLSDVTFPAIGPSGEDWTSWIESTEAGESSGVYYTPAEVQYYSPALETFVTVHRGLITGYGGASGNANAMQFRISDVGNLVTDIYAGTTFSDATTNDVANYVTDRLEEEQPVFSNIENTVGNGDGRITGTLSDTTALIIETNVNAIAGLPFTPADKINILHKRQFSSNRDTLSDVIDWLTEVTNAYYWFEPAAGGGLVLVGLQNPGREFTTLADSDPDRPTIDIIRNRALQEIEPFNQLEIRGGKDGLIGQADEFFDDDQGMKDEYPRVVVEYQPLIDRMGVEVSAADTSSSQNLDELERQARSRLKERLEKVGKGEIIARLSPRLLPYDRFESRPTCDDVVADVNPMKYEVESIAHHAQAIKGGNEAIPHTEIKVTPAVDASKIQVKTLEIVED